MFKLGDIIVDRCQYAIAENLDGTELLYTLTQIADMTIEVSAEPTEVTDAMGALMMTIYRAKTGSLTATNALVNTNIIQAVSGSDAEYASSAKKLPMPKTVIVKAGQTATLTGLVEGTVLVAPRYTNGSIGVKKYTAGEAASDTQYKIDESNVFTPPTVADGEEHTEYLVKYIREVSDGATITNLADKFPKAVKLTIKILYYDPCEPDTLRGGWVEIPQFQVAPDTTIAFATDSQLDYTGSLLAPYCSLSKELYKLHFAAEDEE